MSTVQIMMAVNNPDNGNFTGRCDAIDITGRGADTVMALRATRGPIQVRKTGRRYLKLGHLHPRILGYGTWVGNWCWDCATVHAETAAKVVNYLRRRGWSCEGGYIELGDKYDAGEDVTAADLLGCLYPAAA